MVVRHCKTELRGIFVHDSDDDFHIFRSSFIRCNISDFKPALLLEMFHKVSKERSPQTLEILMLRPSGLLKEGVALFLIPAYHIIPRKHRIAVDLLLHTETHHQLNIPVEICIVILPAAVFLVFPDDHVFIIIETLRTPRVTVEGSSYDLLTGLC